VTPLSWPHETPSWPANQLSLVRFCGAAALVHRLAVASNKWQAGSCKWRAESGKWRVESGK